MLVLSRKVGQSVTLEIDGKKVRVEFHKRTSANTIRLAFYGDKSVKILRSEVIDQPQDDAA